MPKTSNHPVSIELVTPSPAIFRGGRSAERQAPVTATAAWDVVQIFSTYSRAARSARRRPPLRAARRAALGRRSGPPARRAAQPEAITLPRRRSCPATEFRRRLLAVRVHPPDSRLWAFGARVKGTDQDAHPKLPTAQPSWPARPGPLRPLTRAPKVQNLAAIGRVAPEWSRPERATVPQTRRSPTRGWLFGGSAAPRAGPSDSGSVALRPESDHPADGVCGAGRPPGSGAGAQYGTDRPPESGEGVNSPAVPGRRVCPPAPGAPARCTARGSAAARGAGPLRW